jgi:hypothetical protein
MNLKEQSALSTDIVVSVSKGSSTFRLWPCHEQASAWLEDEWRLLNGSDGVMGGRGDDGTGVGMMIVEYRALAIVRDARKAGLAVRVEEARQRK